jgi:hypothetical protein
MGISLGIIPVMIPLFCSLGFSLVSAKLYTPDKIALCDMHGGVSRKPPFFETLACSHNKFGLHYRVWVIDCAPPQAYNVSVIIVLFERR